MANGFLRKALYESAAESLPELQGAQLMAMERAQRFCGACTRGDELGARARAALPAAKALASGEIGLETARDAFAAQGFDSELASIVAGAMRLRSDDSPGAQLLKSIADQIEADGAPEIGFSLKKGLKGLKKGVQKTGQIAHKVTHTGPIAKLERKAQKYVVKTIPIAKPFVDFHNKVSSKLTEKVLKKAGVIKGSKKPKPKPKAPKPIAKNVLRGNFAAQAAASVRPKPALKKPKPPGAANSKVRRIRAKSGREYAVTVRAV